MRWWKPWLKKYPGRDGAGLPPAVINRNVVIAGQAAARSAGRIGLIGERIEMFVWFFRLNSRE